MSDLFQKKFHIDGDCFGNLTKIGYYDYFGHPSFAPPLNYICDWMDSISPLLSIVELGSGTAPILQFLKGTHPYAGIDFSQVPIDVCGVKWKDSQNAHFVQADLASYFDSPDPVIHCDVLYDGNVFWYFNRDRIADYIDKAMQRIRARYFVTMECDIFFPFPECSFMRLLQAQKFVVNIPSIPEFKRQRTIEIYERI
ncbi:MAG TPA: hypothetical protein VMX36_01415 [Sedimentisphaerales bacterium]|nr:hypothetical protein [Sedimentisphaerales bacterium]